MIFSFYLPCVTAIMLLAQVTFFLFRITFYFYGRLKKQTNLVILKQCLLICNYFSLFQSLSILVLVSFGPMPLAFAVGFRIIWIWSLLVFDSIIMTLCFFRELLILRVNFINYNRISIQKIHQTFVKIIISPHIR